MTKIFCRLVLVFCVANLLAVVPAFGDVLVGSWPADSIRQYDDAGNYVGDFVSPGDGGLDLPDGMDFGADGHLYVASSNSNEILRYNGTSGDFIDAFVDTGLSAPGNLKFGPDGFLYVCNKNTGQVLRFHPDTGEQESVFASGGGLVQPVGLLWKGDHLYVADFSGGAIRRYNATNGNYVDNFASVSTPLILNLDADGNVMVSSHNLSDVVVFDCDGNNIGGFLDGGPVSCPVGHLFFGDNQVLVASWANSRLLLYDLDGNYINEFSSGFGLAQPNDLLVMPPQVLLGDVNLDGAVNLLDVSPFVELLTNGEFQAEADINGDGEVDLLDVLPFVELLSG